MSEFLPDNFGQSPPSGVTEFSPGSQQTTQQDVALMQRVFQAAAQNPLMLPPDFMAYVLDYIQTSRLVIPIGQVFGFTQYLFEPGGTVAAAESTTSTSYTDLDTEGPGVTGLPDGKYVTFFGAIAKNDTGAGAGSLMSASANGVTPGSDEHTSTESTSFTSINRALFLTLDQGANDVFAKFKVSAASTGTFANRWLCVIRYASL